MKSENKLTFYIIVASCIFGLLITHGFYGNAGAYGLGLILIFIQSLKRF